MHVAVLEFLLRSLADPGDLHVEVQFLTRERVICVDRHHVALDARDRHDLLPPFLGLGLELHARPNILGIAERAHRHALHQ